MTGAMVVLQDAQAEPGKSSNIDNKVVRQVGAVVGVCRTYCCRLLLTCAGGSLWHVIYVVYTTYIHIYLHLRFSNCCTCLPLLRVHLFVLLV